MAQLCLFTLRSEATVFRHDVLVSVSSRRITSNGDSFQTGKAERYNPDLQSHVPRVYRPIATSAKLPRYSERSKNMNPKMENANLVDGELIVATRLALPRRPDQKL